MSNLSFDELDIILEQKNGMIIHQIWFGTIPNKISSIYNALPVTNFLSDSCFSDSDLLTKVTTLDFLFFFKSRPLFHINFYLIIDI